MFFFLIKSDTKIRNIIVKYLGKNENRFKQNNLKLKIKRQIEKIKSFKDGKVCNKIKGFLFKIVDRCISKKRQEEILKEFNNHIEISEKIDAFEEKYIDVNDGCFVEKETRYYDKKMARKSGQYIEIK